MVEFRQAPGVRHRCARTIKFLLAATCLQVSTKLIIILLLRQLLIVQHTGLLSIVD